MPSQCILTLAANDKTFAISQYTNYNFDSIIEANGNVYGSSSSGLYLLGEVDKDENDDITSFFEFQLGDSGVFNIKRVRALHLGGRFSGDILLTLTEDDNNIEPCAVTAQVHNVNKESHGVRVFVPRSCHGRYWKLRVSSVSGSSFFIDKIHVTWNIMTGSKQSGR